MNNTKKLDILENPYNEKLVPLGEIESRITRLRRHMEEQGLEALLILHRPDYFYFSGTSQNSILFIAADNDPILFVKRDLDRARRESPLPVVHPFRTFSDLVGPIRDYHGNLPSLIGTELDILPAALYLRLRETFGKPEFQNASPVIMNCRMKKSPFEIEQIRKAAGIGNELFEAGRNHLKPGVSEIEFAALLENEAKKRGHEGLIRMRGLNIEGYAWQVLSGPSGSLLSEADTPAGGQGLSPAFPMGPGHRKIQPNEPVFVDFPICYNGYLADQARMYCIGDMPEKFVKAYQFCRDIQDGLLERIRPGIQCADLFSLTIDMADAAGYKDQFLGPKGKKSKFIGHGLGLEANESPAIAFGQKQQLEEHMVLAIEPKIVFENEGMAGIENIFLVTGDGCERLSDLSEDIICV
ncbi:M24 family metallopeptidase [Thermodesulfobacteriota bacterium]